MTQARSDRYREAGVNIDAGDELVRRISPIADATRIPGATGGLGGFGGVFDLDQSGFGGEGTRLVSGTDGVGTKLMVAFQTGIHNTIGIDCVAMCVNDILAIGAKPLFFLDYFATGRLAPHVGEQVVAGVAEGCRQARCWLMGGETAEMPGMYAEGEYDLAGFVVGAVKANEEITPALVQKGDIVIGVASSGLHSNGFSLARHVLFTEHQLPIDEALDGDSLPLGERLLVPTRIYVDTVNSLRTAGIELHGLAHITGGGLWENPQRSVPKELGVRFNLEALRAMRQPIFETISRLGKVSESEMYRVFNMGVGLSLIVPPSDADKALQALQAIGVTARIVGVIADDVAAQGRVEIPGISNDPIA